MAYLRNILLAAVLTVVLTAMLVAQTVAPASILPPVNVPNLIGLCAAVLVLERWLSPESGGSVFWAAVLAGLTFFLLTWASGMLLDAPVWQIALTGGVVFGGVDWLFRSIWERIRSGQGGVAALAVTALGLYLAGQCFTGIVL